MKTPSLHRQVIEACPRGFSRPLSHADYFTEPLELSSGLANTPDHLKKASPGTFGSRKGKLRKVPSRSALNAQRWHAPEGQAKAARTDRLLLGTLARLLKTEN